MIIIENKKDCCGCNACGDVCAHNAIYFKADEEGFLYPVVDEELCNDCGLCNKVCPIINIKDLRHNDFDKPECYAMQTKNLESLFNSTSGSAFATLAERVYKEGGYVGGAIYDDNYSVKQFISSNKADLEKLRNSKLVQSYAQGWYKAIRDIVKARNKTLVCGLPCQMAALRAFLHRDYDNLIIVDLVCRGINTPKLLKGYMEVLEKRFDSEIVYFKVKNKEYGWRKLTTKVVFKNGEVLYDTDDKNLFTIAYLRSNATCRPSCYDCQFKGYPRISDITIADLWSKKGTIPQEMDHDLGTSLVMLNSEKGKAFYKSVESKVKSQLIDFTKATECNPALVSPLSKPKIDRSLFYKDMNSMPFDEFMEKYFKVSACQNLSVKAKLKNLVKFLYFQKEACGWNLCTIAKNIYYNFLCKSIHTNILEAKAIIVYKHCCIDISKTSTLNIGGLFHLGAKTLKKSQLETRLQLRDKAILDINGRAEISYGGDIEVFKNAHLTIGDGFIANLNSTIICGDSIFIDEQVRLGRDVSIRDNNGGHYLSRRTYKDKRSVEIGKHCWLCEGSTIMPGVKLGVGVIVGAKSLVSGGKFKNFTLLSGFPAEVVDEDVYVKM